MDIPKYPTYIFEKLGIMLSKRKPIMKGIETKKESEAIE